MGYFKSEIIFPCGFIYKREVKSLFLEIESKDIDIECPLHGKNCKR